MEIVLARLRVLGSHPCVEFEALGFGRAFLRYAGAGFKFSVRARADDMSDVETDKPSAVPGTFGVVAPAASAAKASASSSSSAGVKLSADKEAAVMAVFDGKHQAIDITWIVDVIDDVCMRWCVLWQACK
jgi:hypothetical protein